ncbi:MAG: leucyl/phenylalanyl-tRNA--protein transferase [Deltaproteobacteria bacterium]|nr:leucyl/phenylalanyl-tRNA--protein transferase [Deltaproteobacteria bacterium]
MPVFYLTDEHIFPPPHLAEKEGLLAVGGDLSQDRLLLAYHMGIFPWYSDEEPVLWWSPDPRLVLYPKEIKVSKTLKRIIKKDKFHITMDHAFAGVIRECAQIRAENNEGTWINEDMMKAYFRLHQSGYAHSVEAWYEGGLIGGLYGVSLGKSFFGESMFTRISNASNVALVKLVEYLAALSFDMVDCQVRTEHMIRFGAREVPRDLFLQQLNESLGKQTIKGKWQFV